MKRWIYRYLPVFLFAALLVAALSLPTSRLVKADGSTTVTWNFLTSDYGCINRFNDNPTYDSIMGTYAGGVGFSSNHPSDDFSRLGIQCADLTLNGVTEMRINWSSGTYRIATPNINQVVPLDLSSNFDSGTTTFDNGTWTMATPTDVTSFSYYFDIEDGGATGQTITSIVWTVTCTDDCGGGGGTLTRPLTSDDEVTDIPLYDTTKIANLTQGFLHEFNIYDVLTRGGPQTVQAWSNAPGAKVHAADAGTIADVKPLTWDDCGIGQYWPHLEGTDVTGADFYDFPASANQPCVVEQYDVSPIGEVADIPWPDYVDQSSVYKHRYWLDASDVYVVTLQLGDSTKIQYLVRNAPEYVVVGDTVDAGCVLGETIPMTAIATQATNFFGIGAGAAVVAYVAGGPIAWAAGAAALIANLAGFTITFTPDSTTMGFTTLSLYDDADTIQSLVDQLTVEPTNDDKCLGTGAFSDCLADNPQFANQGQGWVASGNVEWTEPGVILDPGESVQATINLSSTGDYTATAYAEGVDGAAGELRVFLGSHTQRFPSPIEWTDLQLDASPLGDPDAGTFYTVGVQNTGTAPVAVASLCVTDGSPNLGPNSCYFNNQSFVQGSSGWDVSDGVTESDQALNVPDNGVISQNVMLNPLAGGPATYHLVVRGDWIYTGTDVPSGASAIASIKYEWPDGTGYQDMIPINITGNLAFGAGKLAFMADIEVSETTDAVMNIQVETTDAGDLGVTGIRITDACLSTANGGAYPGQGGGSAPPPLDANCDYVARPQTNDPAAWLQWHWEKSNQFFTCQLRVTLNKMYTLGQRSFLLAGWEARYMQSNLRLWSSWLGSQFFPWLNGQFRNMAIGQVTTIFESGGSCNDLFCVLDHLISAVLDPIANLVNSLTGFVTAGINLFLTLVIGFISVGLALLSRLIVFFNHFTGLFTGIIGAYNTATPATIEGLPICSIDPTSSPFCRAIWVLDNTILGGRWAVLLVIILGIASIHLIIWVIGEFKSAIISAGSSS